MTVYSLFCDAVLQPNESIARIRRQRPRRRKWRWKINRTKKKAQKITQTFSQSQNDWILRLWWMENVKRKWTCAAALDSQHVRESHSVVCVRNARKTRNHFVIFVWHLSETKKNLSFVKCTIIALIAFFFVPQSTEGATNRVSKSNEEFLFLILNGNEIKITRSLSPQISPSRRNVFFFVVSKKLRQSERQKGNERNSTGAGFLSSSWTPFRCSTQTISSRLRLKLTVWILNSMFEANERRIDFCVGKARQMKTKKKKIGADEPSKNMLFD